MGFFDRSDQHIKDFGYSRRERLNHQEFSIQFIMTYQHSRYVSLRFPP